MTATLKRGDTVTIREPDNSRLDGTRAMVMEVTDYGYLLAADAAATGRWRALASEVEPAGEVHRAREAGYEGDPCGNCGALRLRRNGSCLLCDNCGTTTGCS